MAFKFNFCIVHPPLVVKNTFDSWEVCLNPWGRHTFFPGRLCVFAAWVLQKKSSCQFSRTYRYSDDISLSDVRIISSLMCMGTCTLHTYIHAYCTHVLISPTMWVLEIGHRLAFPLSWLTVPEDFETFSSEPFSEQPLALNSARGLLKELRCLRSGPCSKCAHNLA